VIAYLLFAVAPLAVAWALTELTERLGR